MNLRAAAYRRSWWRSTRADCRVISVGNLTMGGTGKTPTVAFVAAALAAGGRRVAVVSRGYRGGLEGQAAIVSDGKKILLTTDQAGDEPVLLARLLPGVPVVIGAKRAAAVALAHRKFQAEVVVCDDAFSHLALQRDVDLVIVHGLDGLGNRRCVPAGPLREPLKALRRASAVLLNVTAGENPAALDDLRRAGYGGPVFRIRYSPPRVRRAAGGDVLDPEKLADRRVLAFAATARPRDFFVSLARSGWEVAATKAFSDHHVYAAGDLDSLAQLAAEKGICYLATTEKDAVKLPEAPGDHVELLVAGIDVVPDDDDRDRLLRLVSATV
jgi:tetraacyldisaccharide 4'-kinase